MVILYSSFKVTYNVKTTQRQPIYQRRFGWYCVTAVSSWTCRENYFGKTHWKRLAKRERLIAEKITLENTTNVLRKSLT